MMPSADFSRQNAEGAEEVRAEGADGWRVLYLVRFLEPTSLHMSIYCRLKSIYRHPDFFTVALKAASGQADHVRASNYS